MLTLQRLQRELLTFFPCRAVGESSPPVTARGRGFSFTFTFRLSMRLVSVAATGEAGEGGEVGRECTAMDDILLVY